MGVRVRDARRRRGWTQKALGARIGVHPSRISQLERGEGHRAPLEIWFCLGYVLRIPFKAEFWRDALQDVADAGHLKMQELMLRLARGTGRSRSFELATRPADPSLSIDVCVRDDVNRVLTIEECWNTFGNVNASVRSTQRKVAEAAQLAVAIGGEQGPFRVVAVWIIRDTRRNRDLIARYPEVFAATFSGSSSAWVKALTTAAAPPHDLGIVWCDPSATRLFAWRRR